MRIITGDETGLLKQIIIPPSSLKGNNDIPTSKPKVTRLDPDETQTRTRSVLSLCSTTPSTQSDDNDGNVTAASSQFAALRTDNTVEYWENNRAGALGNDSSSGYVLKNALVDVCRNRPVDMKVIPNTSCVKTNKLLACVDHRGDVAILENGKVTSRYNVIRKTLDGDDGKSDLVSAFGVGDGVGAVGRRDQETFLFDLETGKEVWKAKNIPPDRQTLLQYPIWGSSITFLAPQTPLSPAPSSQPSPSPPTTTTPLLAVGTAHSQIRIYDVRLQRRPVLCTPIKKPILLHRVTSLTQSASKLTTLLAGDTAGFIHLLDMRRFDAVLGRYAGPAGSVRDLAIVQEEEEEEERVVVSVGLDRFLWCHGFKNRRVLEKVYLKQRLNCCLVLEGQDDDEDELQGDEDIVKDYVDSDEEGEGCDDDDEDSDDDDNDNVVMMDVEEEETSDDEDETSDDDSDSDDDGDEDDSDNGSDSSKGKSIPPSKRIKQ